MSTDPILTSGCPKVKMRAWGQRVAVSLSHVRAWIVSHSQVRSSVTCCLLLIRPLKYLLGQELGDFTVGCRGYQTLLVCGASGNGLACTKQTH